MTSFLPEVENGKIVKRKGGMEFRKLYTPPALVKYREEKAFEELQNMGHEKIAEDFSDSPHLKK